MIIVVEGSRHGKAVEGVKRRSSWQVRNYCLAGGAYLLLAQFRFVVGDEAGRAEAQAQADQFANQELVRKKILVQNAEAR